MTRAREYFVKVSDGVIAYVHFTTDEGEVGEFVVKLLVLFADEWHEVIRYDSGHGCPHKDIIDNNGSVIRKIWYDFLDNGQALTMAVTDIKDNYEFYKARYLEWLREK